jgi:DNA-binding transcriptional MerR regulator
MPDDDSWRLDELARRAGVATTTVRLYQARGLLPGPRLVGRTGYYDHSHLARLGLIGRLADQGFSLAGIARLLETLQAGRDLGDLVGVEGEIDAVLGGGRSLTLDAGELAARLPAEALTPELMARAGELGLVEPMEDGRFRVPDRRFLDTGTALVGLGVPAAVVLEEWAHLRAVTDGLAQRFVALFETHVLAGGRASDLDGARTAELAATLGQLRRLAEQVLAAALDASLAGAAAERLDRLAERGAPAASEPPGASGVL